MESALLENGAIARQHLSVSVHDRLLADIVRGRYTPGDRLNVREIAARLSVSVAPVREALTRLHNCGFVQVHFHSSTVVSAWSVQDMHHRIAVLGRVLTLLADDPHLDIVECVQHVLTTATATNASPAQTLLSLANAVATRASNRVAAYICEGLLLPMELFLDRDTLLRHGADAEGLESTLVTVVADLSDAADAGDADQLRLAFAVGIAAIDAALALASRGR